MDFDKLYDEALLKTKVKVLEDELQRVVKENADLRKQLTPPEPVEPTREEKAKAALADHMLELVKASTEDNITSLVEAKTEFLMFADKMRSDMDLLRKQFESEVRFNEFLAAYTDATYKSNIMKHKKFIIERMIKDEANFEVAPLSAVVKKRSVQFTIHFVTNQTYGLYVSQFAVENKPIWSYPQGIYTTGITKWEEFIEACAHWTEHLQKFPNTSEKFQDELVRRGLA